MKKLFKELRSLIFPKLRITEETVTKELILGGKLIMTNKNFTTWYGGINPRVEDHEITISERDGGVMKDFDFTTYSQGLIAEGRDVLIRKYYTKEEKLL
ncbi:MAG: hypothetical protein GY861_04580 [bacterium]|nr:hypothetical protein [bacterium]